MLWTETAGFLVLTLATLFAAAVICFSWSFHNTLPGAITTALLAGSTATPIPVIILCIFAHPRIWELRSNKLGFIVLAGFPLGHVISYMSKLPDTSLLDWQISIRNLLYLFSEIAVYYCAFREPLSSLSLSDHFLNETASFENDSETWSPLSLDLPETESPQISNKTKSDSSSTSNTSKIVWRLFMAMQSTMALRMFSELFPVVSFGAIALVALLFLLFVLFIMRNERFVRSIPMLMWYTWGFFAVPITLDAIYRLADTAGVNIASLVLTVWGVVVFLVFHRFASGVITDKETLLFLFPIQFAIDITQSLFYLADDIALYTVQFWVLLGVQELCSIFLNTGLKDLALTKLFVLCGKPRPNPFSEPHIVRVIVSRAFFDTLSEQMSLLVVITAVLTGSLAMWLGANVTCVWCGASNPELLLPVLGVLIFTRVCTMFLEQFLTRVFIRRWGNSSVPSFSFKDVYSQEKFSGFVLLGTLNISLMFQILCYFLRTD